MEYLHVLTSIIFYNFNNVKNYMINTTSVQLKYAIMIFLEITECKIL